MLRLRQPLNATHRALPSFAIPLKDGTALNFAFVVDTRRPLVWIGMLRQLMLAMMSTPLSFRTQRTLLVALGMYGLQQDRLEI